MRLGLMQFAPRFGAPQENLARIAAAVRAHAADLWVLPELCTTGYALPTREACAALAEPCPGPTTDALAALCRERGTVIVAGLAERVGTALYNSAALVTAAGVQAVYRKVHLFDRERLVFDPGPDPFAVHTVGAWRIGLMVCFDWAFPEAARSLALQGAEVIAHPSNLVLPYCQAAMPTRSLENAVFIATANRVGSEPSGERTLTFTGRSQVTSPRGRVVAAAGDGEEVLLVDIDPAEARDKFITERNDRLADRRPECYRLG